MKKNILFLLFLIATGLTGCDPMDDTYTELDNTPKTSSFSITLTDQQYKVLPSSSAPYKQLYFSTDAEAVTFIPTILNSLYKEYSDGAAVTVNYTVAGNVVSSRTSYTVTAGDYTALGITTSRLNVTNGDAELLAFLNYKYPAPTENQLVILTFNLYNSNMSATAAPATDSFYYANGKWNNAYHVSATEYAATGAGRFLDYSSADKPKLGDYFNKFLSQNVSGAKVGDVIYVSYLIFDNSVTPSVTEQRVMAMSYTGINWVAVTSNAIITSSQGFVKDKGTWIVDPTINYSLVAADYVTISNISTVGTDANRANLGSFKNFNISPTGTTVWTDAQVTDALAAFLKVKFPSAATDSKYRVTYYAYFSGAYSFPTKVFKKNAAGDFVVVK